MDKFVIRGGEPLLGTVRVSGAKNAALPCMAAALLTEEPVVLENIPDVRDIQTMRKLLVSMGAEVELGYGRAHHRTTIDCLNIATPEAPYDGHHVQVYTANFSGPYRKLLDRNLVSQESNQHQYRFVDIVDLDTGAVLFQIDHEVRSMTHPMYGRPLANRDSSVSLGNYRAGHEALAYNT